MSDDRMTSAEFARRARRIADRAARAWVAIEALHHRSRNRDTRLRSALYGRAQLARSSCLRAASLAELAAARRDRGEAMRAEDRAQTQGAIVLAFAKALGV
jgi:hypothetical protein